MNHEKPANSKKRKKKNKGNRFQNNEDNESGGNLEQSIVDTDQVEFQMPAEGLKKKKILIPKIREYVCSALNQSEQQLSAHKIE